MPDDIPSLADLRRSRAKRTARSSATPSLFDAESSAEPAHIPKPSAAAKPSASEQGAVQGFGKDSGPNVYTVGELVRRIRELVERTHQHILVEGEISNWRPAASGHCYFTLKDGEAQLPIVLFRRQAQMLRFRPKDGDAVRVSGSLSVYESRGQLQLIAETMQQTGLGALLAATQALKDRLRCEGLFENRRPLPPFPRCIGVVTSLQGAALRDIVKVCRRRHAAVNLIIYPAAVQGPHCAAEVAAGVRWFNAHPERADVILIARGGGSWEDLHGFDDEALARTIAASGLPVLTGIGHAPDSTIADAAADLCAPTPSAAAELVTAAQHDLADRVARLRSRLDRANRYELLRTRQRLTQLSADSVLNRVRSAVARRAQRLDDLIDSAEAALERRLRAHTARVDHLESRLRRQHVAMRVARDRHRFEALQYRLQATRTRALLHAQNRLNRSATRLDALSPLRVLDRGYALIYGPGGTLLRSSAEAPEGSSITAQLSSGRLHATVTSTE